MTKLTDTLTTVAQITGLKPDKRIYRRSVIGDGLCIEVHPNGGKYWRFRYRFHGVQKMLSLGVFGERSHGVTMKEARTKLAQARATLADGIDPSAKRQQDKAAARHAYKTQFRDIAADWLEKQGKWAPGTRAKFTAIIQNHAFPWIGKVPIGEVSRDELLSTLQRLEDLGKLEAAHKLAQLYRRIFSYALNTLKIIDSSPATELRDAVKTRKVRHHAAITNPADVGALMRAIDDFSGTLHVKCALRLSALTYVRPGELRRAEWSEIDWDAALWRIPAGKMKKGRAHVVPLSDQALSVLREMKPLTGAGKYVFPCARSAKRPMSENTVTAALRRMGYSREDMTAHGFRGMASTLLHEQGWRSEVIERQLAHVEGNAAKAAYNHAEYLAERTKMMQAWADYLDSLRNGGKVTPIRRRHA